MAGRLFLWLLIAVPLTLSAAQQTDFSGTWTPANKESGLVLTIDQSPSTVSLRMTVNGKDVRVTSWTLGDTTLVASGTLGGLPASTRASLVESEMRFVGEAINKQGATVPVKESWRLDSTGTLLTIVKVIDAAPGSTLTNSETFRKVR